MSIQLGQLGAYAFTLTVSPGEPLDNVKLALNSYIELTDWEVWDAEYSVYRSLNVDGSYKYLRLFINIQTALAYTGVYASWDNVTHTGENLAQHNMVDTPAADMLKTGFYLTHVSQQIVIHVYVHPRWLLISSVYGTSNKFGLPNTWAGSHTQSSDFRASATLKFSGIGGCLELHVPENTTNIPCTPFIWFHTAWSVFDMYMEDQRDVGNDWYAFSAYQRTFYQFIFGSDRTPGAFARIPKNVAGNVGNVSVTSILFRSLWQLRMPTQEQLGSVWSTKKPVSDLFIRDTNNAPLGNIFGLKAMPAGTNTFGEQISTNTDSNFLLGGPDTHTFALLHTEVVSYLTWDEWVFFYYGYTWYYRGGYTTTLTPKFFIPIN